MMALYSNAKVRLAPLDRLDILKQKYKASHPQAFAVVRRCDLLPRGYRIPRLSAINMDLL